MNYFVMNLFSHMQEEEKVKRAKQVAWIAGIFTTLVSLLLILNYMQIRAHDPLESKVLKTFVERLAADPGNHALIEEIRQLDLLARKAYFNSIWQIRTGAALLLAGAIALIAALRIYSDLRFAIDKPSHENLKERQKRTIAQRWVIIAGFAVIGLAAASAIFSADHLKLYQTTPERVAETVSSVEQVDIVRRRAPADPVTAEAGTPESAEAGTPEEAPEEVPVQPEPAGVSEEAHASAATALTARQAALNHNAFRGAWGQGVSQRRNIPVDWDGESGRNIRWKTEIPLHGYNSPVLWEDRLFLTGANQSKRVVYALNRHTGAIVWEREANNIAGSPATPPRTTDDTGLAAPTMTADAQRVYAIFGTGDIISFDHDGNRQWARNLGVPMNHYGHSSSLVTWDGNIFVQYDTQDGSRLLALDAATGQTIWETRRSGGVSWASPIIIQIEGNHYLVLSTTPDVAVYDIQSGSERWSLDVMSGEVGPSPAFGGGLVYAANEYARLVAINPVSGELVWEDNYYLPEVSSPLYHDGLLYIATSYAVFACFDATNGEFLWEFDSDDGFYSSPMLADGKIFIFDMGGRAYIFNPGREADLIASPKLGERVYATPVFADGRMYIRGNRHVYCIGN